MINAFERLNLSPVFSIDISALEAAYFAAQRQYHPDHFVNKPAEERLRAVQLSADINEAYNALKHPLTRAKHLLGLRGITVLDEKNTSKPDAGTLMEMMELQEHIAEGHKPDIAALIVVCEKNLAIAFEKNDLETAKTLTIRLSYLYKMAH